MEDCKQEYVLLSQRGTRRQSVHTERQRQLRKAEADTGPNDKVNIGI